MKGEIIIENYYDIWFSSINIKNKYKLRLLELYDSNKIWNLNEKEFMSLKIRKDIFNENEISKKKYNIKKYQNYIIKNDIKLISVRDKNNYPKKLYYIDNMPAYLYVRGNINNLYSDNVAVVGSRHATEYGRYVSRKIGKELADMNINIVSGLALGIDKFAHLGALDSRIGKTIAVLGTGVSNEEIYPYQNKRIFERILENGGTIISEYKLNTAPNKENFPLRNRIISGISDKIIIVEATKNSGSLITARYGLEQGKDIYAVPGNITSKNSIGTNKLIEEGAYLFKKTSDILY